MFLEMNTNFITYSLKFAYFIIILNQKSKKNNL